MIIKLDTDVFTTNDLVKELEGIIEWVKSADYDTKELMDGSYRVGKTFVELDLD